MVDPGDWLPLLGVALLAVTTLAAIAGAYAFGRNRGLHDAMRRRDEALESRERLERMERSLEGVAEEIERLGEVQRFALKVIAERAAIQPEPARLPTGRVITPH